MKREPPEIIERVGFDFSWDEKKVWRLDLPTEEMPIEELVWHLDIPFLWSEPDGFYDLKPRDVISNPKKYPEEYQRTLRADAGYPIDIMRWRGKWLILDGLHRLMKEFIDQKAVVIVRKVPESAIPFILKDSK